MDSPLSGIITEIFIQHLEHQLTQTHTGKQKHHMLHKICRRHFHHLQPKQDSEM
jgi:hypothetical protein